MKKIILFAILAGLILIPASAQEATGFVYAYCTVMLVNSEDYSNKYYLFVTDVFPVTVKNLDDDFSLMMKQLKTAIRDYAKAQAGKISESGWIIRENQDSTFTPDLAWGKTLAQMTEAKAKALKLWKNLTVIDLKNSSFPAFNFIR